MHIHTYTYLFLPKFDVGTFEVVKKVSPADNLVVSGVDIKREMTRYRAGLASAPIAGFMVMYNKHTLGLEDLGTLEEQNWLNDQVTEDEEDEGIKEQQRHKHDKVILVKRNAMLLDVLTLKLPSLPPRLLTCMENSSWRQHNTRSVKAFFSCSPKEHGIYGLIQESKTLFLDWIFSEVLRSYFDSKMCFY